MQIDMATEDVMTNLGIQRGKECAALTQKDYLTRKRFLRDQLNRLKDEDEGETSDTLLKIASLENEAFRDPTKTLVGKEDLFRKQDDNANAIELARRMVEKMQEERRERREKRREKRLK
jgi:hypothetical protein